MMTLEKQTGIISSIDERYGRYSRCALHCRYAALADLLSLTYHVTNDLAYNDRIVELRGEIVDHYSQSPRDSQHLCKSRILDISGRRHYVYDQGHYDLRYRYARKEYASTIMHLDLAPSLNQKRWYTYIVTRHHKVRICVLPIHVEDVILGRKSWPIVHPMLAEDDELTVLCAGELMFCGQESSAGIIVNNASGHYRPSADTLREAVVALGSHGFKPSKIITIRVDSTDGQSNI
jgi:hypothetical protein